MKKMAWVGLAVAIVAAVFLLNFLSRSTSDKPSKNKSDTTAIWIAPDLEKLAPGPETDLIVYGKKLIENTSFYLGPRGTVAAMSNGLNCQNCHLDAGTRLNSNCLAAVATTYPKLRHRSGKMEDIDFRINECMERSLNGVRFDSSSRELQAMKAYMVWLGTGYEPKKGYKITGTGPLDYLSRAADPEAGKKVFQSRCTSCHGLDGLGLYSADSLSYTYPPLWGPHSYNVGAGMYTLSKLAGFIKYNMPYSATPLQPQLTDEEAWDLAAFINTQQRTEKEFPFDWPDISKKPVDYPIGPYTDNFSEKQHKYGPFKAIIDSRQQ